jgi:hypothetical protein
MFKYIDAYLVVSQNYEGLVEMHGAYVNESEAQDMKEYLQSSDNYHHDIWIEDITVQGELS